MKFKLITYMIKQILLLVLLVRNYLKKLKMIMYQDLMIIVMDLELKLEKY